MDTREGQVFGNYQVLSRLGSGGMGSVYLAEHPLIGKRVALKVIHKDLARSNEVLSRFFNEARAVNRIGNEHIVEIHDVGETPAGEHFFVMEYIHGRTLGDVLATEGALPVPRALHIAAQISSALEAAHSVSIVHRDLKPENVMLTTRVGDPDFVKILDFGLAKMLAETNLNQLTAQGVVLGTPHYMAPEICEGQKRIDHRTDIYALGVLMFHVMTGRLPFEAPSMGSLLLKHVTEPPPAPRGINPAIPPAVEQIILRCMAKDPDARFPWMSDLRQALLDPDRYLAGSPPVVPSASPHASLQRPAVPANRTMHIGTPPVRPRWPLVVTLLALAGLAGAAAVLVVTEEPARVALPPDAAAVATPAPVTAAPVAPADAALGEVTVRITTRPAGAQVLDADGALLGTTPTGIELPRDGREHVLVFRHPEAEERRKVVVASGDTELELELVPLDEADEPMP